MKFNINHSVTIRLTDAGRAIVKAGSLQGDYKEDEAGRCTEQLWLIMRDFGPHMFHGGDLPFDTVIDIPRKPAEERVRPSQEVEALAREIAVERGHRDAEAVIHTTDAGDLPVWWFYIENAEAVARSRAEAAAPTPDDVLPWPAA